MDCLIVMRRLPEKNSLRLLITLMESLIKQGHHIEGVFLMGKAVNMLPAGCLLTCEDSERMDQINPGKLMKRLFALIKEQGLEITACGRSLQNHGIEQKELVPPFAAGGYYELLQRMQTCERVIEI